jgi:hypothetical protein
MSTKVFKTKLISERVEIVNQPSTIVNTVKENNKIFKKMFLTESTKDTDIIKLLSDSLFLIDIQELHNYNKYNILFEKFSNFLVRMFDINEENKVYLNVINKENIIVKLNIDALCDSWMLICFIECSYTQLQKLYKIEEDLFSYSYGLCILLSFYKSNQYQARFEQELPLLYRYLENEDRCEKTLSYILVCVIYMGHLQLAIDMCQHKVKLYIKDRDHFLKFFGRRFLHLYVCINDNLPRYSPRAIKYMQHFAKELKQPELGEEFVNIFKSVETHYRTKHIENLKKIID